MRAGYVRLAVALLAAAGMHAMLLFWPASSFPKIMYNGMLSVDLSDDAAAASASSRIQSPAAVQPAKPQAKKSPVHVFRKHMQAHPQAHPQATDITARPLRREPSATVRPTHASPLRTASSRGKAARSVTRNTAPKQDNGVQGAPSRATAVAMPGRIPSRTRSLLLAHIEYPRPARRRGWQGKGEFQLLIARNNVRKVKVLASTGYHQLDQAVRRGLLAAGRIPLGDGIYKLPVEFRLQ